MELGPLVDDFVRHIALERGLSPHTVDVYGSDVRRWLRFLGDNGIPQDTDHLGVVHVRHFVQQLSSAHLAPRTVMRCLSALRAFFTFLCRYHGLTSNPAAEVDSPKLPDTLPRPLTHTEVARLLDATAQNYFSLYRVRDRCILAVLACLGLRRQELMDLRLEDWDAEQRVVTVRSGKGSRDRALPLTDELVALGEAWLEVRPRSSEPYLLLSRHGEKLSANGLQRMLQRVADAAGLEQRPHMHMFRHFAGTAIVNNHASGGIEQARRILGHVSNSTVSVYAHLNVDDLRPAVRDNAALSGLPVRTPGPAQAHAGLGPAADIAAGEVRDMLRELPKGWQGATQTVDWLITEWARHCLPANGRPLSWGEVVAVLFDRQTVPTLTLDQHFALAEFGRAVRRRMLSRRKLSTDEVLACAAELGGGMAQSRPVGEGTTAAELRAVAALLPGRDGSGDIAGVTAGLVSASARLYALRPDLPNGRQTAEVITGLLGWGLGLPPLIIPATHRRLWDLLLRQAAEGDRSSAVVFCLSQIQGVTGELLRLLATQDHAGDSTEE